MAFGNGPRLVTTGLDLLVDAADKQSYPGSGTVWTDLRSGTTGSLTGSVSYTSEFYGGLTFSNSSSAVIFPSTVADYGTGSFTVEMAFKPTYINGKHYLMAKNSGSFPNWAIYLSGSGGSGKLWSEFNVSAAISCSYSSSTVFQTGSAYQVDVRILPGASASGIYVNGQSEGGTLGNGGGSLTTTASLFVGNFSQNNTQNFSGSIYTIKTYLQASTEQPVVNYNATSTRFSKPPVPETSKKRYDILVVGGGASPGYGGNASGGGGAGGYFYYINQNLIPGKLEVRVGAGGASVSTVTGQNGGTSQLGSILALGGGTNTNGGDGFDGGSGGGSSTSTNGQGTVGQGNNGGTGNNDRIGAGGGGAGSPGVSVDFTIPNLSGDGGSGSFASAFAAIGGSPAGWFAGGGGGGVRSFLTNAGSGGKGGGGNGGKNAVGATDGVPNTGGGGGGNHSGPGSGSAGGSGIVAIRYNGTPIALGGEITQSAGYTYHVFRTVGTSTFTIF